MATYYHISERTHRPSILEHGLDPQQNGLWAGGGLQHTWLFDNHQKALDLAQRLSQQRPDSGLKMDCWHVDDAGLAVEPDPHGEYAHSFAVGHPIPLGNLTLHPYEGGGEGRQAGEGVFDFWNRHYAWRRIAATSRRDLIERRDQMLESYDRCQRDNPAGLGQYPKQDTEPGGEVLHTLPSGHKIVKLHTQFDHDYESELNDNCIRDHVRDGNTHSLRDKDNISILSFAMDKAGGTHLQCQDCEGYGEHYDEGADRTVRCPSCNGSGYEDEDVKHNSYWVHDCYGRGNTTPKDENLLTLANGLKEMGKSEGISKMQLEHTNAVSFDKLDEAQKAHDNVGEKLPKGDVYLKVPSTYNLDEHGHLDLGDHWGHGLDWSEQDPGPGAAHKVYKTPFSRKRFDVDSGVTAVLHGHDIPEKPNITIKERAVFPSNALHEVHKPLRPTHFFVRTSPDHRENPDTYGQEGLHARATNGDIIMPSTAKNEDGSEHLPLEARQRPNDDLWEVHLTPEQAQEHLQLAQYSHSGTSGLNLKKDFRIPWENLAIKRVGEPLPSEQVKSPEFPRFENGKPKIEDPTHLYVNLKMHNNAPWHKLEGFANAGFHSGDFEPGDVLLSKPMGTRNGVSDQDNPVQLKIPNDPRYVEELGERNCDKCDGTGKDENRSDNWCGHCRGTGLVDDRKGGMWHARRQFRLKPDTFIPREDYEYSQPESPMHTRETENKPLVPSKAYLHIPMKFRDKEEAFTEQGIDISKLTTEPHASRSSGTPGFKITTEPNHELEEKNYSDSAKTKYHPMGPHEADVYELDLSKMPNWRLKGDYTREEMGEKELGETAGTVTRVLPELKELSEEERGPLGMAVKENPVIPWEAVTGLHSKAGGIASELQKRKLIASHQQSQGWGSVQEVRLAVVSNAKLGAK